MPATPIYERVFAQRRIPITDTAFTDVFGADYLPIDCNYVLIFNDTAVTIYLRTDPANANSESAIEKGQQYEIGCPRWGVAGHHIRFVRSLNDCPCSLKSSSGNVSPLVISIL